MLRSSKFTATTHHSRPSPLSFSLESIQSSEKQNERLSLLDSFVSESKKCVASVNLSYVCVCPCLCEQSNSKVVSAWIARNCFRGTHFPIVYLNAFELRQRSRTPVSICSFRWHPTDSDLLFDNPSTRQGLFQVGHEFPEVLALLVPTTEVIQV